MTVAIRVRMGRWGGASTNFGPVETCYACRLFLLCISKFTAHRSLLSVWPLKRGDHSFAWQLTGERLGLLCSCNSTTVLFSLVSGR